jgi:hypothetical protein
VDVDLERPPPGDRHCQNGISAAVSSSGWRSGSMARLNAFAHTACSGKIRSWVLTKSWGTMSSTVNSITRDIGGGLVARIVNGRVAHWNVDVPGHWERLYPLERVGSYISKYCEPRPGVYRLIALDDAGKPASLDRVCGSDQTGTLYIGCEGKNFAVRSRLSKLVRSLRDPGGRVHNREHLAGYRLRTHQALSERFPVTHLALTWCYTEQQNSKRAEEILLDAYFESFGDSPPLNWIGDAPPIPCV